jgi:acyl-homoserine-lactone acylase
MRSCVLFLALAVAGFAGPRNVEILWDNFGVAHVFAKDTEGLFFGYGYAQMQSHGDLILKLYGESRGRGAEYWGDKYLESDKWVNTNRVPERGLDWYKKQTPEFKRYLDAFADGMNEYARRHPDQLNEERKRVLPITGADPVIHFHRIVHFSYLSSSARVTSAATGRSAALGGIGSNAWAIAPKKSASGNSMMIMNPHLPWQDWYTYYEAHLNAPGINLYGGSQVGFPVLRFSMSDYVAFTQTVNSIDGSDLYKLTLKDDGYMFDGKLRKFTTSEHVMKIRQPDGSFHEQKLQIRETVHGPVVWDKDGLVLAQRTAALDRPFLIEQYWKMAIAHDFKEYEAQVSRLEVPTFNITYADRDGHIMYLFNGTLPKRSKGDLKYWAGIVPGDTSETLWTAYHSYDELPKVIDPPTGWVQNTNDPPWTGTYPLVLNPAKFPAYTAGRDYTFRTMHSIRMLNEHEKISFEEMIALKHSTRMELADRVAADLIAAAEASGSETARRASAVLKSWDHEANNDSRGALLFDGWATRFLAAPNFAVPLRNSEPLTTPRGLKDPAAAVKMLEDAAAETVKHYGSLDAPWGDFRRLRIGKTDLPANGAGGNVGSFRVLQYGPPDQASKRSAMMGDTFVLCLEFSNPPRAQVLVSYGNSSQPGSPHHEDQLPLLSQKKLRPVYRQRAEVEQHVESKDVF